MAIHDWTNGQTIHEQTNTPLKKHGAEVSAAPNFSFYFAIVRMTMN
jgi:hypothetical protein